MKHIHSITFRGSFPIDTWNRLIRFLYENNIPYKTINNISPTKDDCTLNIWYERIIFKYDTYIAYKTNRKTISIKEFLKLIKQ